MRLQTLFQTSVWFLTTCVGLFGVSPSDGSTGKILVTGGFTVAETDAAKSPQALATSLKTPIELEVSIPNCSGEPLVSCEWKIQPQSSVDSSCNPNEQPEIGGDAAWQGCDGKLILEPPEKTGSYDLQLTCQVEGQPPLSINQGLWVTYGEPVGAFSSPETAWLDRATCWAGGLSVEDGEAAVLREILRGMYEFGHEHWQYGYARQHDTRDQSYVFPLFDDKELVFDFKTIAAEPTCNKRGRCKCSWESMVEANPRCSFGDCYIFSDIFQAISGVMGVGGLKPWVIRGKGQAGFLTVKRRSIDPAFPGTGCDLFREECYEFQFGNHSLRLRGDTYFDATFSQVYDDAATPIAFNKKPNVSGSSALRYFENKKLRRYRVEGSHYGTWTYFQAKPDVVDKEAPLRFPSPVKFEPGDEDEDGVFERLVAKFDVELVKSGTYLLYGGLNKGKKAVARQPQHRSSSQTVAVIEGKAGQVIPTELDFSGQEIFRSSLNGPYNFFAVDESGEGLLEARTQRLKFKEFGELDAALPERASIRPRRHGDHRSLQIVIHPFKVRKEGRFMIEARLAKGDDTIVYSAADQNFSPGAHRVELEIPGRAIAEKGLNGPWEMTIILYDERLSAIEFIAQKKRGRASAFR